MWNWQCRACAELSNGDVETAATLFQDQKQIYTELVNLEVQVDDDLPKYMCRKCSDKLTEYKTFKTTCHLSIQILQNSLLIKVKEEEESSSEESQPLPDIDYVDGGESSSDEYRPENTTRKSKRTKKEVVTKADDVDESRPYLYFCKRKDCKKRFKKLKPFEKHCQKHVEAVQNDDNVADKASANVKPRKPTLRAHPCTIPGCDKSFKRQIVRDSHVITHNNGGIICCPICLHHFKQYHHMLKHSIVHQSKEERKDSFTCPVCQRTSISKASFFEHMQSHKGRQHVCDECGKVCVTSARLRVHKHSHESPIPEVCPECGRTFTTKNQLHGHRFEVHRPKDTTKVACIVCGTLVTKRSLLTHCRAMHTVYTTEENVFGCPLCSLTYKTQSGVRVHVKVAHRNERKHECSECPLKFSTPTLLRRHSYTHTGERPFKCDLCEKGFLEKYKLQVHMRGAHGIPMSTKSRKKDRRDESSWN